MPTPGTTHLPRGQASGDVGNSLTKNCPFLGAADRENLSHT